MTTRPGWMRPPRLEGWFAEDLDHLPEAPAHTELIDGVLVFMMSPRRWWHGRLVDALSSALMPQLPEEFDVVREMTIKLDSHNRPEPDLLITNASFDADRTWFAPQEVQLVIKVILPELAFRDRTVKLRKYAEAGISHYWLIEDDNGTAVVHVYELDQPTMAYAPAGIFRHTLQRSGPFDINIDLDKLIR